MPRVVLIRHGEASDPHASADGSRHLTPRGREVSRQVALALRDRGIIPTHVYTSPLVRAVQTAEILAHAVEHSGPVVTHDPLVPNGSSARALGVLSRHPQDDVVALVTHEPLVRALAGHLLSVGGSFPGFRTSGAAVVDVDDEGRSTLLGRLDPSSLAWRGPDDLDP